MLIRIESCEVCPCLDTKRADMCHHNTVCKATKRTSPRVVGMGVLPKEIPPWCPLRACEVEEYGDICPDCGGEVE